MNQIVFDPKNRRFMVSGDLNFTTVSSLGILARQLMEQDNELVFDFQSATCSDSSGLALLTTMMRCAKIQRKSICFLHLPPQLLAVAAACNLDNILPIVRANHG